MDPVAQFNVDVFLSGWALVWIVASYSIVRVMTAVPWGLLSPLVARVHPHAPVVVRQIWVRMLPVAPQLICVLAAVHDLVPNLKAVDVLAPSAEGRLAFRVAYGFALGSIAAGFRKQLGQTVLGDDVRLDGRDGDRT